MGIQDIKENPLDDEVSRKVEKDCTEMVDKELPPLEAKARVSRALLFLFAFFFASFAQPGATRSASLVAHQWRTSDGTEPM